MSAMHIGFILMKHECSMTKGYQRQRTEGGLERQVAIVAPISVTFIIHRDINPTAVWLI